MKKREEKASRKMRRKLLICLRKFVQEAWSETRNQRLREPHKTRRTKRTSAAKQKREQRTQPPKTALLSPL